MDTATMVKNILNGENLLPYDETSTLEKFREAFTCHPQFKDQLEEQLKTQDYWLKKLENEQIFFIVHDDRWKRLINYEPGLKLKLVGKENSPVISISL